MNDPICWDDVYADICPPGFRFLTNEFNSRLADYLRAYGEDHVVFQSVWRDVTGKTSPYIGTSVFVRKGVQPK